VKSLRIFDSLRSARRWGVLGLALVLMVAVGLGQAQQSTVQVFVQVSNEGCRGGVQIAQFTFIKGSALLAVRLVTPPIEVAYQETRQFEFELNDTPTAVNLRGTIGGQQPLDVTAPVGTTEYECGVIELIVPGEEPEPTEGPELPPELGGIAPGMSPQQVISRLQLNGFDLEVQGSEAEPKLSDVSDPLMIGALGPGLTGVGYWVSGPGQLRAVVLGDRPGTNMVLLVVSNFAGFCLSLTPPGGGLTLFCDRPAAFAPLTTIGGGPVPGTVFLVLVLKIGGSTQPFVLSLSG